MIRYVGTLVVRRIRETPVLFLLTVSGVALGVASVVTVQLLNLNAIAAFEGSLDATSNGAALIVRPYGPSIEPGVLPLVLGTAGVARASVVHQANVRIVQDRGNQPSRHIQILGIDLLGAAQSFAPEEAGGGDVRDLIVSAGIALSESLATDLGVGVGTDIVLGFGSDLHTVRVAALLENAEFTDAVMDIAWSDALFGPAPSQVNVELAPGAEPLDLARALQDRLGPGVRITTPGQEGVEARGLLSAFRLNLTALSMISVFVGAFLVYGTTRATLVRRRGEFGVLRSLGATQTQVLAVILSEIALLGVAGVLIGLPGGYLAAKANVSAVSGTLTSLYLLSAIEGLAVPPWIWLVASAVGVGAALLGGLIPAIETTTSRIRALLSTGSNSQLAALSPARLATLGLVALSAGLATLLVSDWTHRGMAVAFILVSTLPLVTPWIVRAITRPLRPARLGILYALSSLNHRLTSAGIAIAGLGIAVSMMVGITIMVWSFRQSLTDWIDATVQADVYVSAAAWRGDRDTPGLTPETLTVLASTAGVAAVDRVRGFSGRAAGRSVALRGVDLSLPGARTRFHFLATATGAELKDPVYISEPLARKAGLRPGDSLALESIGGVVYPTVAGVLRDYGSERGSVTMDLSQMAVWFGPGDPHGAALYLESDADVNETLGVITNAIPAGGLTIRPNRFLRTNALRVFDETFQITLILQAMALLIATVGVTLTLFVLGHDEAGVLALYRGLGATRGQVFRFFVAKGVAIALVGTGLGLVTGGALAALLIYVTNPAYFGWSLDPHVPGAQLLGQVGWILLAAVLASIYPAFLASRPQQRALNPIEA